MKKKGIIATSAATIAVCASVIAGSTYALFSDSSSVNIAVTSAKVKVSAQVSETYNVGNDANRDVTYVTPVINGGNVSLNNIAPGEWAEFTIDIVNDSSIDVQYRTTVECVNDDGLLEGLVITVNETADYSNVVKYSSAWQNWLTTEAKTKKATVKVHLPERGDKIDNKYNGKSVELALSVEAVQGNAGYTGVEEYEYLANAELYVNDAKGFDSAVNYVNENGGTVTLLNDVATPNWISVNNGAKAKINLNGHTLASNGTIYVDTGAELTVVNGTLTTANIAPLALNNGATVNLNKVIYIADKDISVNNLTEQGKPGNVSLSVLGKDCKLNVTDSKLSLNGNTGYVINTNATINSDTGELEYPNPEVNVKNSTIDASVKAHSNIYTYGIMFNVPGTLNISDSKIIANRVGVLARGGNTIIENSTVTLNVACTVANIDNNYITNVDENYNVVNDSGNELWKSGGSVPFGAIIIGNHSSTAYNYPAEVTLVNSVAEIVQMEGLTTVESFNGYKSNYDLTPIVIYGNTAENYAKLTYDDKSVVGENIVKGPNTTVNGQTAISITNLDELLAFAADVNGGNNYAGKTVYLANDIDLAGINWTPIGGVTPISNYVDAYDKAMPYYGFTGTFDGLGHTIYNLSVNSESGYAGLFGLIKLGRVNGSGQYYEPVITNLNVYNANVNGASHVGVLLGNSSYRTSVSNCHVMGNVTVSGNYQVGGFMGSGYANIYDCSITANSGSSVTGTYLADSVEGDAIGGFVGYYAISTANLIDTISVSGLNIAGTRKVGGVIGHLNMEQLDGNDRIVETTITASNITAGTNTSDEYAVANAISVGSLIGEYSGKANGGVKLSGTATNVAVTDTTDESGNEVAVSAGIYGRKRADNLHLDVDDVVVNN